MSETYTNVGLHVQLIEGFNPDEFDDRFDELYDNNIRKVVVIKTYCTCHLLMCQSIISVYGHMIKK